MVVRLPTSSTNTRGNKSNGNAKFAATPHRRSTVLFKYFTQRFHRKLGELENQFARNFRSTYKRPASLEEVKSCLQRRDETLRSYIQRWSVIKNSAEDVSDERAIDAFSAGLHHSDFVEEIGRINPRTVSELMEVANRFADGEDAYNNKRGRSPEVDKTSRQRRRYRNGDNHGRRNQTAAGYDGRNKEGYESRELQARDNRGNEKLRYSGPSAEDIAVAVCDSVNHYLVGNPKRKV
jgi:hypothetical protein